MHTSPTREGVQPDTPAKASRGTPSLARRASVCVRPKMTTDHGPQTQRPQTHVTYSDALASMSSPTISSVPLLEGARIHSWGPVCFRMTEYRLAVT